MLSFVFTLLLLFQEPPHVTPNVAASDNKSPIVVKNAATLSVDEKRLLDTAGGQAVNGKKYTVKYITLKEAVKPFYGDRINRVVAEVKRAQTANKGKLGPFGFGSIQPEERLRVLLVDHYFGGILGGTDTPRPSQREMGMRPSIFVSTKQSPVMVDATIAHELIHASCLWDGSIISTQSIPLTIRVPFVQSEDNPNPFADKQLMKRNPHDWFFSPREIDPRLAELKRVYSNWEDKNVYTVEEAKKAWEWAKLNPHMFAGAFGGCDVSTENAWWLMAIESACTSTKDVTLDQLFRRMTEVL